MTAPRPARTARLRTPLVVGIAPLLALATGACDSSPSGARIAAHGDDPVRTAEGGATEIPSSASSSGASSVTSTGGNASSRGGAPSGPAAGGSAAGGLASGGASEPGMLPDASAAGSGSAVAASSSVPELCEASCNVAPDYPLPIVLCADWRLPDRTDGTPREYEFCEDVVGTECAERCVGAVEGASDACAAILPSVVSCVARTGFYANAPNVVLTGSCHLAGCEPRLLEMMTACSTAREELAAARAKWSEADITNYEFRYDDRLIGVTNGVATVDAGEALDPTPTIDDLFDEIAATFDQSGTTALVEYDDALGIPTKIQRLVPTDPGCYDGDDLGVSGFAAN